MKNINFYSANKSQANRMKKLDLKCI